MKRRKRISPHSLNANGQIEPLHQLRAFDSHGTPTEPIDIAALLIEGSDTALEAILGPDLLQYKDVLLSSVDLIPKPGAMTVSISGAPKHPVSKIPPVKPAPPKAPEAPALHVLESARRLSESRLWQIQADYYNTVGVDAWTDSVPFFISSSVFLAEAYADLLFAYIEDIFDTLDLTQPLHILELATGSGRLSFLLIKELIAKLSAFQRYQPLMLRYVMTDFSVTQYEFWRKHENFQPWIEQGLLDFAIFDPMNAQSLKLEVSGETLDAAAFQRMGNPVIAVANYYFDTIYHDLFKIENGQLFEGQVALSCPESKLTATGTNLKIHDVTPDYRFEAIPESRFPYYDDLRKDALLSYYQNLARDGTLILPVGGMQALNNLQVLTSNRLVLLSSDKSFTSVDQMYMMPQMTYAAHGGAFSFMVNYDAIRQYMALSAPTRVFNTESGNMHLQTVFMIQEPLSEAPPLPYERVTYVFREKIKRHNPINTVVNLMPTGIFEGMPDYLQGEHWLSYLRINLSDPNVFDDAAPALMKLCEKLSGYQKTDLDRLLTAAWENYYYFPGEKNLPFWLSQLYYSLQTYDKSLFYLLQTARFFGENDSIYYLQGECLEKLGYPAEAVAVYLKAVALNPDQPESKAALHRLYVAQQKTQPHDE